MAEEIVEKYIESEFSEQELTQIDKEEEKDVNSAFRMIQLWTNGEHQMYGMLTRWMI